MLSEWGKLLALLGDRRILLSLAIPFLLLSLTWSLFPGFPARTARAGRTALAVLAAMFAIVYVANAFHYIMVVSAYDHLEPSVATVALGIAHGMPMYHGVSDASRYSLMYGPNTFLAPLLATRILGETIEAMKVMQVLFSVGALGLFYAALRRSVAAGAARHAGVIFFCAACLFYPKALVWVRADPQMLFWVTLGLLAATYASRWPGAALLGVAAGACFGAKVHGVFYFVPILFLTVRERSRRFWGAFGAAAAVTAAAPLLARSVSLTNYVAWLGLGSKGGLAAAPIFDTLQILGLVLLPIIVLLSRRTEALSPDERRGLVLVQGRRLIVVLLGLFAVIFAAVKNGSGAWHFVPLVPVAAWLFAVLLGPDAQGESCPRPLGLAGHLLVGLLAVGVVNGVLVGITVGSVYAGKPATPLEPVAADAALVARRLPGVSVAMGYGDDRTYPMTFVRNVLPAQPAFTLDAAAYMGMQLSGVPLPAGTLQALRDGLIRVWLIPKGTAPFSMHSFFGEADLFGPELRKVFGAHYRKTGESRFFDLWTYQPG